MATLDELIAQIEAADAARQIPIDQLIMEAQRLQEVHGQGRGPALTGDPVEAALRGVLNMGSGGFMDEARGAVIGALAGGVPNDEGYVDMFDYSGTMGDRYAAVRDQRRDENAVSREANPVAFGGGEIVGGIGASVAAMPTLAGRTGLGLLARATGLGATEGAVMGAGTADGTGVVDNAIKGGFLGGLLGGAAVPVAAGVRALGRAVSDPVGGLMRSATGGGSPARAARALERTVYRSGMDIPTIENRLMQAAAEGQPEYVLADALGRAGQRRAAGVARMPGEGSDELAAFLNTRQAGQGDRVGSFVSDALETSDTARIREAAARRARGEDANANYAEARDNASPVNLNGTLEVIDTMLRRDPILGETALSQGPLGARLMSLRNRLEVGGEQLIDFDTVLNIKTDMFNAMQRNPMVRNDLMPAYRAMDKALEDASTGYRNANDTFRQQSQAIEAIVQGVAAARPMRTEDALGLLSAQTLPDAQAGFRAGFADPLMSRIENTPPGVNAVRQFLTPKNEAMMSEMATDPGLFSRRIGRESEMFETRDRALMGSRTADNLADQAEASAPDIGLLSNIAQGRVIPAAAQVAQRGLNAAVGLDEGTRTLIARALMSNDPQAALRPLIELAQRDAKTARALEAFLRFSGYEGAEQRGLLQ